MDDYAGRVLADRYRLPLPPPDPDGPTDPYAYPAVYDLVETRAFDTYSGQEVRIRQVPLPEVVDAEVVEPADAADFGDPEPGGGRGPHTGTGPGAGRATRRPADPVVRRAVEAAQAAARIPDHPRLEQVFDVFAEAGSLWIVSEFVAAAPLAELLAMGPLSPYRAAEIGADLLTALRTLHAFGWTHRNVTARTVLVCEDGRVVLTGLAAGAAEEALCGYAPVPPPDEFPHAGPPDDIEYAEYNESAEYAEHAEYVDHADHADHAEYADEADVVGEGHTGPGEDEGEGAGYAEDALYIERAEPAEPVVYLEKTEHAGYGEDAVFVARAERTEWAEPVGYAEHAVYADHVEVGGLAPAGTDGYALEPYPSEGGAGQGEPDERPEPEGAREPEVPGASSGTGYGPYGGTPYGAGRAAARPEPPAERVAPPGAVPATAEVRAVRAGAIAAYRAGARAAARIGETGALPIQRPATPSPQTPQSPALPLPQAQDPPPPPPPASAPAGPAGPAGPQWWSRPADDDGDDGDDEPGGYGEDRTPPPPPRAYLAGSWSDGPHASRDSGRSVPAGGGPGPLPPALPAGYAAAVPEPRSAPEAESLAEAPAADLYRGPVTRLAAERARQTRMAVVGAVTERWAPEQAGPVHEHWRLAPPIGPATDLWALGALLYRAVQGHAPYPEDNAGDLVQLVCAEPPAFAEECGPLRPVVESLLRQDPTERPDVEELSGWLRSLVRSAPEPDAGTGTVPPAPADATRLPLVRKRGELVRRRRWWAGRGGGGGGGGAKNGRHRHAKSGAPDENASYEPAFHETDAHEPDFHEQEVRDSVPRATDPYETTGYDTTGYDTAGYEPAGHPGHPGRPGDTEAFPGPSTPDASSRGSLNDLLHDDTAYDRPSYGERPYEAAYDTPSDTSYDDPRYDDPRYDPAYDMTPVDPHQEIPRNALRKPRAPGRTTDSPFSVGRVLLVLLVLLLGGAVAYAVVFMPKAGAPDQGDRAASNSAPAPAPPAKDPATPSAGGDAPSSSAPASKPPADAPSASGGSDPALASGYTLRKDPEGFRIGVPSGWRRSPINDAGQVRYTDGDFTMIVVPGRDSVKAYGDDPLRYQRDTERELTRWRESSWSDQYGLRRVDIGQKAMAEGTFSWIDSTGHEVVGRNLALIEGGRYHVVQVVGPSNERDRISAVYDQAVKSYRVTR
ncbi:hypothetical protein AB0C52_17480 [Streptomyces sp. NPDC048717]|uniref:hypothetical protein n=1 Tax=Streptomyces sp. NPDC048717 TaxID=3154928 RepID=UPI00342BC502